MLQRKVLLIRCDNTHRKCKELVHSSVVADLFNQPCFSISPMQTATIKKKRNLVRHNSLQIRTIWEHSNSVFLVLLTCYLTINDIGSSTAGFFFVCNKYYQFELESSGVAGYLFSLLLSYQSL
jgi:hypothetical protein